MSRGDVREKGLNAIDVLELLAAGETPEDVLAGYPYLDTLLPEVSAKALEGLKFSACLPPDLAVRVLRMPMTDFPGVRKVLAEPVRFIVQAQDGNSPS